MKQLKCLLFFYIGPVTSRPLTTKISVSDKNQLVDHSIYLCEWVSLKICLSCGSYSGLLNKRKWAAHIFYFVIPSRSSSITMFFSQSLHKYKCFRFIKKAPHRRLTAFMLRHITLILCLYILLINIHKINTLSHIMLWYIYYEIQCRRVYEICVHTMDLR